MEMMSKKGRDGLREPQPKKRGCLVPFCKRSHYGAGYCQNHYMNSRRAGSPLGQFKDLHWAYEYMLRQAKILSLLTSSDTGGWWEEEFLDGARGGYSIFRCRLCAAFGLTTAEIHHEDNCPVQAGDRLADSFSVLPEYADDWAGPLEAIPNDG